MPRLIWVFAGRTGHFVGFSCGGSFYDFLALSEHPIIKLTQRCTAMIPLALSLSILLWPFIHFDNYHSNPPHNTHTLNSPPSHAGLVWNVVHESGSCIKTVFSEKNYVPSNPKMPKNEVMVTKILPLLSPVPMMFLCKFGQNPPIGLQKKTNQFLQS